MHIFRRTNCILTASGIVALCKWLHSTLVKSELQSALNQCTSFHLTYVTTLPTNVGKVVVANLGGSRSVKRLLVVFLSLSKTRILYIRPQQLI